MDLIPVDLSGQTIGGRYELEADIGGGGMGRVYLARDLQLKGRAVVVKVPHADLLDDAFRRRFDGEIAQLIDLEHPGIIPIFDAGEHEGLPYLVVRYVAGGDLRDRMPKGTRLSLEEVGEWLRPIASALDYIHRTGRVHRDVKPGNILFDVEGHAYLSDFGIATVMARSERGAAQAHMTGTGLFMGSPRYAPPEAAMRELSPQYDQYSLGLMVYEALTGAFPFEGKTGSDLMWAKFESAPRPIESTGAHLAPEVAAAVMRAIERDRERRHPSCRAFADAVAGGGGAVAMPREAAFERETRADTGPTPPPSPPPPQPETEIELDLGRPGTEVRRAASPEAAGRVAPGGGATGSVETAEPAEPAAGEAPLRRWGWALAVVAVSLGVAVALVTGGPDLSRWLAEPGGGAGPEETVPERPAGPPVEEVREPASPVAPPVQPAEPAPAPVAKEEPASPAAPRSPEPASPEPAAPAFARLTVRSNVSGDRLSIDGREVGPTSATAHEIEPGRHVVRVEKEGFVPWERPVELSRGETRILRARLVEPEALEPQRPVADAPRPATDLVAVPAGPFHAGCNPSVDDQCEAVEKPGRTREIPAFAIDRTEVTVEAFGLCVAAGACSEEGLAMPFWAGRPQPEWAFACNWGKEGRERHPINCVDWYQARDFCRWRGARLPSEWEWEKAARGDDGRRYAWGSQEVGASGPVANLADQAALRVRSDWNVTPGYDDGFFTTSPVGSFAAGASPYGALDMIGNVWEWTDSSFEGDPNRRVLRGGSWVDLPRYARASARIWAGPHARNEDVGFRCAR